MKVSVEELRALPHRRLTLSFCQTLEGLAAVKPVLGELSLISNASGVRVSGTVKTLLKLNCDRCLNPYFQSLSVDIDERFVPSSEFEAPKDRELLKDDFVEPLPANGILDINDIVYQAVTLATPSYALCGAECKGPPATSAISVMPVDSSPEGDLSEGQAKGQIKGQGESAAKAPLDPRWKNLKSLFPKEES